jgi:hypothetical protein
MRPESRIIRKEQRRAFIRDERGRRERRVGYDAWGRERFDRIPIENDDGVILFTVTDVRRESSPRAFGDAVPGWNVTVELPSKTTWGLSQLDDEPVGRWVVDSEIRGNGFPVFVHGFGSRVTQLLVLDDDVADRLNQAIRSLMVKEARS